MKFLYITLILLFLNKNFGADFKQAIIFEHTGINDSVFRPLLFSTDTFYPLLDDYDIATIKRLKNKQNITIQEKKEYSDFKYNKVLVDKNTYNFISKFVLSHVDYYVNNSNRRDNPAIQSFGVRYNGKLYIVYSRLATKYINELKICLIKNHCSLKSIQELSNFRYLTNR